MMIVMVPVQCKTAVQLQMKVNAHLMRTNRIAGFICVQTKNLRKNPWRKNLQDGNKTDVNVWRRASKLSKEKDRKYHKLES